MSIGLLSNRARARRAAPLLALALAVAACGGDDDDDAGSATTSAAGADTTAASRSRRHHRHRRTADTADTAGPAATTAATDRGTSSDGTAAAADGEPATLRLGYFPNVTHAPAIIGVETGLFAEALGANVTLESTTFNSGTEVIEAMFSGALDASFIGPNPAINGYAKSNGEEVRIVAGTTSGGASLVVREGIDAPEDLAGTKLATPSLGNTQDVALRAWLQEQGYTTDTAGGGDVTITPQDNADTLTAFQTGAIDGAWVPEPWATRLVNEGGGHVLVDERDIWPDGRVRHHPPHRDHRVPRRAPRRRASDLIEGLADAIDDANGDAADRPADRQRRHREGHDEPPRRRDDRRGVGEPRVHARPDRLVVADVGRPRHRRRAARPRRPRRTRHLRPDPAQRGPRRARRARPSGL